MDHRAECPQLEQVPLAIVIFGIVLLLALLFWSTPFAMWQRKRVAMKLALIAAVAGAADWLALGRLHLVVHAQ
jgi:hypothetical protein